MTRRCVGACPSSHATSRGFSLVELMVALALGLAVSALVARVWTNNRQAFRNQENSARIQENARFALQLLERELRMTGYKGLNQEGGAGNQMFGTNGNTNNGLYPPLVGYNDTAYNIFGAGGASVSSDTLVVAFYGSGANGVADNTVTNCFGYGIPAGMLVQDTFSVAPQTWNGFTMPALMCNSTYGGAYGSLGPLVFGVESLQVLYGEETDGLGTGVPNRLVHAGLVTNFDNVTQVRVSLLVRGEDRTVTTAQGQSNAMKTVSSAAPWGTKYYHFGKTYATTDASDTGAVSDMTSATDGRHRELVSTTVSLRNRIN